MNRKMSDQRTVQQRRRMVDTSRSTSTSPSCSPRASKGNPLLGSRRRAQPRDLFELSHQSAPSGFSAFCRTASCSRQSKQNITIQYRVSQLLLTCIATTSCMHGRRVYGRSRQLQDLHCDELETPSLAKKGEQNRGSGTETWSVSFIGIHLNEAESVSTKTFF